MSLLKKTIIILLILVILLPLLAANSLGLQQETNIYEKPLEAEGELNSSVVFIFALILIMVTLFILEPLPISILAILVPISLTIFNKFSNLSVEEALSGFGNSATITVMSMFVFSAGIQRSGAVQLLGDKIFSLVGENPRKQIGLISILAGTSSAFINNTPIVAALIPMVSDLGRKTKVSPSKLLIPLSYAAMLGGTITLIGTSTNLLASQVSERILGHPFSMFEFTPLGIIVLLLGIIYLVTIGYKLIPARLNVTENLTSEYEINDYLTEVIVEDDCRFIGKSFAEVIDDESLDYEILRITRQKIQLAKPLKVKQMQAGDHLIIRADRETLLSLVKKQGMKILPGMTSDDSIKQSMVGKRLLEIIVPAHSFLINKNLKELHLSERYNFSVLALRRGEELTHEGMSSYRFRAGDLLLVLATDANFNQLRTSNNFIINCECDPDAFDRKKAFLSVGILLFFIITVALRLLPVAIAALSGAFLMVLTSCIDKNDFFNSIDWEVYFLLSGLIPLGLAIEKSGTAAYISSKILTLTDILPVIVIAMIIYLATSIMANIVGNNASVLLMLPIAIETALQLGVTPFSFVIITTFAASAAFSSPIGYQTNLMVYSAGGFKFKDFFLVGAPLQLTLTIVVPLLVQVIWGF